MTNFGQVMVALFVVVVVFFVFAVGIKILFTVIAFLMFIMIAAFFIVFVGNILISVLQ